ncbi:MAG: hypothetical protein BWZ06_00097 [Bacteroidetes bacterium ADurb.BinA261]|jgi:hypothetical protein|nr:MAG: hypothetical protein BWZ06_00097 [Bacteroidetes bacterium ADurb.BinA261]
MSKSKEIIYAFSCVLILAAAAMYMALPEVATWTMVVGVVIFSAVTAKNPYPGKSIRGKRLFMFRIYACVLMAVGIYFMFRRQNIWFLMMLIASVFLIYSAFLMPRVWEKEQLEHTDKES